MCESSPRSVVDPFFSCFAHFLVFSFFFSLCFKMCKKYRISLFVFSHPRRDLSSAEIFHRRGDTSTYKKSCRVKEKTETCDFSRRLANVMQDVTLEMSSVSLAVFLSLALIAVSVFEKL